MYSEYCRLRDEVPGYVTVPDYGEEGDSWSKYDYTESKYAGKMFNIYWDEIDDNTTKFYATHAFKYCLEHNTLWFDEYVISKDEEVMEDFMRYYRYGMNVVFVDGEDLEFNIEHLYDIDEKNLYDVPIHSNHLERPSPQVLLDMIESCIDDSDEVMKILELYYNTKHLEDREYMAHELLELGYTPEKLHEYMRYTDEYHRIYASMNTYMIYELSNLLTGYSHWYYSLHKPWHSTLRKYYLSCPYIKEKVGSKLESRPYIHDIPKIIWTKE